VGESLDNGGNDRDDKWTKSIAVGSKEFIEEVRLVLGAMAKGRKGLNAAEGYQLRDPSSPYKAHFDIKKPSPRNILQLFFIDILGDKTAGEYADARCDN